MFFRDGLDWRWRSYSRVADQVVRAARSLRELVAARSIEPESVGIALGSSPQDRISAILAAQYAGYATGWPGSSRPKDLTFGSEDLPLPTCRGILDAQALLHKLQPSETAAGGVVVPSSSGDLLWTAQDVEASADSLVHQVDAAPLIDGHRRPILFAQAELLGSAAIVSVLTSLSLKLDAAWTLEPQVDAFISTILWVRPSLLVTRAAGAEALCNALGSAEAKSDRKKSRLRRLVVCEPEDPGERARARWSDELGAGVDLWLFGDGA